MGGHHMPRRAFALKTLAPRSRIHLLRRTFASEIKCGQKMNQARPEPWSFFLQKAFFWRVRCPASDTLSNR